MRIGRFETIEGGVEAVIYAPESSRIDGKALWLDFDASE